MISAPLKQSTGELLRSYIKLALAYVSTETGPIPTHVCKYPSDWNCYEFKDGQGLEFVLRPPNLYELTFQRKNGLEAVRPISNSSPILMLVFERPLLNPPHKKELWSYGGRKDNVVMLSSSNFSGANWRQWTS